MHSARYDAPSPLAGEGWGEGGGKSGIHPHPNPLPSRERGLTRSHGFTLVEILVALAVLTVAMGAIISAAARYADNAAYLREKTLATWVARNRLAELLLAPAWPDTGESDGDAHMGGRRWLWHAQVSKTQDPMLRRIDVEVRTSEKGAPVASLSGFMAPPAQGSG